VLMGNGRMRREGQILFSILRILLEGIDTRLNLPRRRRSLHIVNREDMEDR
jgi:hypothetical protein